MRGAAIVRPTPATISGAGFTGLARLATAEPKEVAVAVGGAATIILDLGSVRAVDTIFVGFTSDRPDVALQVSYGAQDAFATAAGAPVPPLTTKLFDPRRHYAVELPTPVAARFVGIAGTLPAGFEIGVVAVGAAFAPQLGHEMGAGRPITSTGATVRRPDGGIASEGGVTLGGFAWTYGDLSDGERDDLYAIVRDRGFDLPVLVIEESGLASAAMAERFHWSTFGRIDTYERRVPDQKTIWSLRVDDWE